jgi:signal transduction histidine kinase/DNA-binding response OmpR family regulator/ligand-binding sensor domain-containing protein
LNNLAIYYPYYFLAGILYIVVKEKYRQLRKSKTFKIIFFINNNNNSLKKYSAILITSVFCSITISSVAQTKYIFNTKRLTVKDGLAHQEVYDIYQDSRGFMWMATRSGLSRYDGYKFSNFTKEQNGLTNNSIHALSEDGAENLWLFSQTGVGRKSPLQSIDLLDIKNGTIKTFATAFPSCPFLLKDVQLYFSNSFKELFFYAKNTLWKYTVSNGFQSIQLPSSFIPEAYAAGNSYWGVMNKHLVKVSAGKTVIDTAFNGSFQGFEVGSTQTHFLQLINPDKKQMQLIIDGALLQSGSFKKLAAQYFSIIKYDENKKLTWASNDMEIYVFDELGRQVFSLDKSTEEAFDRIIRKIYLDRRGAAWLATESGVLMIEAKKEKFERYLYIERSDKKDKDLIQCRGIFQQGKQLYVGTYKGAFNINLTSLQSTKLNRLTENNNELGDRFTFIKADDNHLFVGAKRPIVLDVNARKEQTFIKGVMRSSWSSYIDSRKRLYLGTDNGLLLYDREKSDTVAEFRAYNQYEELAKYFIPGIIKDRSNITWVISNNGLYILDEAKGIIDHYGTAEKADHRLLTDNIQYLYQDRDGMYWICTGNAGLIKWNRKTGEQKQYSKTTGLSSNCLYALYEDKKGILWISSDYGLMQFNKENEQPAVYTPEDGISHYEFNRISHYQASDGRIYFGGMNGVTAFYPDDFYDTTLSKSNALLISGFQQYIGAKGRLMNLTADVLTSGSITLNPSDRFFSIQLTATDYMNANRTVYYYKIEGFDKSWIRASSNEIRYGRLPYGDYTLIMKAQLSNNEFTPELSLRIYCKRPWYLHWWFYVLAVIGIVGFVTLFFRFRIKQLQERKRELELIVDARTKALKEDKAIIEKQAKELKELDTMKSNFFVNISHELRTPLTLLAGPIHALLKQQKKSQPGYEYLQLMEQSVDQLQNRVSEILDLSKLDAGKFVLNETVFSFQIFLEPIVLSFKSLAVHKDVNFEYRETLTDNLFVKMDKEQVKKIFNNLLSNAIKFTPENGMVTLVVEEIEDEINITVTDTGEGIEKEEQDAIFERFYQSKKTASVRGGTGIGLALTKHLVNLMNGKLSLQSKMGKGAVFCVKLPKKTVEPIKELPADEYIKTATATEEITDTKHVGATILVVEDNINMQQYLTLELNKFNVLIANNGAEAMQLLASAIAQPQLIISDIMMPVMDGYTLLENLKTKDIYRKIPVIMLTARTDIQDKLRALRVGVDDYLVKPFITDELVARVTNLLNRFRLKKENEWLKLDEEDTEEIVVNVADHQNGNITIPSSWLVQVETVILEYLNKKESFTLDTLAEKIYISKRQLQRNIKAETGLTANNYIKELRLHRARLYIESKTYGTLAELSYAVGFNDPHYFSILYTERFGKKPSELL